jgi:hypothetical protein
MQRVERHIGPPPSLGDRAVVIAGILAVAIVALFGAAPDEAPRQPAPAARVAQR